MIIVCLGVNLIYGRNKYLQTFRRNSHKFKLLFSLHFYYMLFWSFCTLLRYSPVICHLLGCSPSEQQKWVGLSGIGISIHPLGMLICFTTAWFFNKKYYYRELSKTGYVEKLFLKQQQIKNFKEVIRKEV